jgi:hypothetical protein
MSRRRRPRRRLQSSRECGFGRCPLGQTRFSNPQNRTRLRRSCILTLRNRLRLTRRRFSSRCNRLESALNRIASLCSDRLTLNLSNPLSRVRSSSPCNRCRSPFPGVLRSDSGPFRLRMQIGWPNRSMRPCRTRPPRQYRRPLLPAWLCLSGRIQSLPQSPNQRAPPQGIPPNACRKFHALRRPRRQNPNRHRRPAIPKRGRSNLKIRDRLRPIALPIALRGKPNRKQARRAGPASEPREPSILNLRPIPRGSGQPNNPSSAPPEKSRPGRYPRSKPATRPPRRARSRTTRQRRQVPYWPPHPRPLIRRRRFRQSPVLCQPQSRRRSWRGL